ncbi:hypothetical protein COCOBI_10-3850 [Coccomyxa sp. Obi]|nr:hypothetical protein COCOBI_10-3850 [Coccomyxa sp. Obi]
MNPHQQSCSTAEHQYKTAASWEPPKRSLPAGHRGSPGMEFLAYYISMLKQSNSGIPCLAEGQVAGCKRDRPASLLTHNPFQSCITEQLDLPCWRSDPNRPEAGRSAPLPDHQSKRLRSCPVDDQEDVAESMPWGPAEALAVPDYCPRHSVRGNVQGRDHSSHSTASSHWQFQVWPQPTFKLHRDVLEDDATSPYSASCSEED